MQSTWKAAVHGQYEKVVSAFAPSCSRQMTHIVDVEAEDDSFHRRLGRRIPPQRLLADFGFETALRAHNTDGDRRAQMMVAARILAAKPLGNDGPDKQRQESLGAGGGGGV